MWMSRTGPFSDCCRLTVPLGQSYHQSAPRSPLYSPQSGGPYDPPYGRNVSVDGSRSTSVPPPAVRRTATLGRYGRISGLVARERPTTTLPVRWLERGSIR